MTALERLRRLAEEAARHAIDGGWYESESFAIRELDEPERTLVAACSPEAILALIADIKRLIAAGKLMRHSGPTRGDKPWDEALRALDATGGEDE